MHLFSGPHSSDRAYSEFPAASVSPLIMFCHSDELIYLVTLHRLFKIKKVKTITSELMICPSDGSNSSSSVVFEALNHAVPQIKIA